MAKSEKPKGIRLASMIEQSTVTVEALAKQSRVSFYQIESFLAGDIEVLDEKEQQRVRTALSLWDSMCPRIYIVAFVVVALAIWGPLDHSWPAWQAIRTAYLILAPVATGFLLGWIWRLWQPDAETVRRLERSLVGATAGILFAFAITLFAPAVEDDQKWAAVFLLLMFSGWIFRLSITMDKMNFFG